MGITLKQLSDTVQKVKDYIDNKTVKISEVTNNAIEEKTDGIYVEKTAISAVSKNALSEKSDGLYVQDLSEEFDKIDNVDRNIYSTTEQVFGTWIDGKTIYRKTLVVSMPQVTTDGTSVSKTVDISGLKADTITNIDGFFAGGGYTGHLSFYTTSSSYLTVYTKSNNTVLHIASNTKLWNTWTMYVTLQYTKTTD